MMIILLCTILHIVIVKVHSQDLAWIGESMVADRPSENGTPGGRSGTGVWQGGDRMVWMFGGMGVSMSSVTPVLLNDVWMFSLSDGSWKQVHPGTVSNLTVVAYRATQIPQPRQLMAMCGTGTAMVMFGGLAEEDQALGDLWVFGWEKKVWRMLVDTYAGARYPPSENSTEDKARDIGPSPRGESACWCTSTHMYLFAGRNESNFIFSDMWRLSLQDFTWEELQSSKNAPDSLRDHTTADYPSGRNGAMTWVSAGISIDTDRIGERELDESNNSNPSSNDASVEHSNTTTTPTSISDSRSKDILFMFGGNILNKSTRHIATGFTSDMWRYDVSTDTWHYITGRTQPGQPANYGRLGEVSSINVPGCRRGAATWTDSANFLWMFGGEGADAELPTELRSAKLLSDFWRFHLDSMQWVWMGGSQKGEAEPAFTRSAVPPRRVDSAAWEDTDHRTFYIFGGLGHDGMQHDYYLSDLWLVDVSSTLAYNFYFPAVYGFALVMVGMVLLLCLIVVAMYARDRSTKASEWRHSRHRQRYSLLHDSDT